MLRQGLFSEKRTSTEVRCENAKTRGGLTSPTGHA